MRGYLVFSMRIIILCCLLLSFEASADIWGTLAEGYSVVRTFFVEEEIKPEVEEAIDLAAIKKELNLPENWNAFVDREPVFDSKVFIVEAGQKHAQTNGTQTIVLIHGLGQVGFEDWLNVIPELEKNYHVLALDLPGFGRSSIPKGRYSPTNYAKVIAWLTDKYAKKNGKRKTTIVGHSMGGAVALRYASQFPNQIEKLILVDVAGILERTAFTKHTAEIPVDEDLVPNKFKRVTTQIKDFGGSLVELGTVIPDFTRAINASDEMWNDLFSEKPNLNAAMALIHEDFYQAIKQLPYETRIIWGEKDNVAPLRTGEMLLGRMRNASLSVIEWADHVPMKSHANEFNRVLNNVLKQTIVDSSPIQKTERESSSQGDLICNNNNGVVYSGRYDNIYLENCVGVRLDKVYANSLVVKDSVINITNSKIFSEGVALSMVESVLVSTNSTFQGSLGIKAEGSRLDMAGVSIVGDAAAVDVGAPSRFIFSVSDISSEIYTGSVHGVYRPKNRNLDSVLSEETPD